MTVQGAEEDHQQGQSHWGGLRGSCLYWCAGQRLTERVQLQLAHLCVSPARQVQGQEHHLC